MFAAPLTHDISTPRRHIDGRCRKWVVSTQPRSDKRKCAACSMCGQQFSHGESRLQQWCNRNSQRADVHQDHKLHPKQPTDQDSVEAVARQRDCITQPAVYSEIVLSLTSSSDQATIAAPADDEPAMFGREEALRLDEEIMSSHWFDVVTWDNI